MGSKSKNKGCSKKNRKNDSHSESQQLDRIAKVCCKGNNEGDYYLKNDPSAPEFREQLNKLGLDFREVPSDGNCLFSSLSDQLYGTIANHKQVREQAVLYIETHKEEFEPFFDVKDRLNNLRSLGTYGGHECIIAISRYFSVYIIIHQLKQKPWLAGIPAIDIPNAGVPTYPQLHLAYHNGEHYSSVRVFGDTSTNPTRIKICLSVENSSSTCNKKCVDYSSDDACSDDNTSVNSSKNRVKQSDKFNNCNTDFFQTFPFNRKLSKKDKRQRKRRSLEMANSDFVVKSISALHI
uniref:OTU domain-containing protein n=1 Tax=Trichobilharzia regenti TaxID=157069 RepID=A0AA85KIF3_TRIRE|nr:unnamed protein product [Trichobilharzia regenti]